jgi:hypothetical protein
MSRHSDFSCGLGGTLPGTFCAFDTDDHVRLPRTEIEAKKLVEAPLPRMYGEQHRCG